MYKLIVGNISSERQDDWFRKDENPYAVWEGKSIIEEICIGSTWVTADAMLRDQRCKRCFHHQQQPEFHK